jgi:hypothetical protein
MLIKFANVIYREEAFEYEVRDRDFAYDSTLFASDQIQRLYSVPLVGKIDPSSTISTIA